MAEQGGPNDTNKKGHNETNLVEGRGPNLRSSTSPGSPGGWDGESLAEDAVARAQHDSHRRQKGFNGGKGPGAEDGPSMVPNTGRGTGPNIAPSMHTDTELLREASRSREARDAQRRGPNGPGR